MKHDYIFFVLLSLFVCLDGMDAGAQNLAIGKSDGTELIVALNTVQKIIFSDNNMELNYVDGTFDEFLLSSVGKLYFTSKTNGVDVLADVSQAITVYPNPAKSFVKIANLAEATSISVYRIDGTKMLEETVSRGNATISVGNLPSGIYLLKANNQVIKFIKQ